MFLKRFVNTYEFKVHATSSWNACCVGEFKLYLGHAKLTEESEAWLKIAKTNLVTMIPQKMRGMMATTNGATGP